MQDTYDHSNIDVGFIAYPPEPQISSARNSYSTVGMDSDSADDVEDALPTFDVDWDDIIHSGTDAQDKQQSRCQLIDGVGIGCDGDWGGVNEFNLETESEGTLP